MCSVPCEAYFASVEYTTAKDSVEGITGDVLGVFDAVPLAERTGSRGSATLRSHHVFERSIGIFFCTSASSIQVRY
jgi:hypothetical protein